MATEINKMKSLGEIVSLYECFGELEDILIELKEKKDASVVEVYCDICISKIKDARDYIEDYGID